MPVPLLFQAKEPTSLLTLNAQRIFWLTGKPAGHASAGKLSTEDGILLDADMYWSNMNLLLVLSTFDKKGEK